MQYNVVNLNGGELFNLVGVRFGTNGQFDKSFLFWAKKNVNQIKQIKVVFDKKNENVQVQDGVMVLSLKGLTNYEDIKNAILIFFKVTGINQLNVSFEFVVENERQMQIAEALHNEFGIDYVINNVNQVVEEMFEEKLKSNISVNGSTMLDKYDNGVLKQITVHDGVAYENNGFLNSEEEKVSLLKRWMQDPVRASELMKMSDEELDELLSREVLATRKQYRLEEVEEQLSNDKASRTAVNMAEANGGLVNAELNIVQHSDSRENQYSAVEKNGDNVQVVNPNVSEAKIGVNGVVNNNVYSNVVSDYENDNQIQQRDVEDEVFYIDDENNILNNNEEVIGKLGNDGYRINYENNSLFRYEQLLGYLGDYKNLGKSNSKEQVNVKKRVLEKKDDDESSSGFVSLAVIMFLLSALLLIGSVVLLFVLD